MVAQLVLHLGDAPNYLLPSLHQVGQRLKLSTHSVVFQAGRLPVATALVYPQALLQASTDSKRRSGLPVEREDWDWDAPCAEIRLSAEQTVLVHAQRVVHMLTRVREMRDASVDTSPLQSSAIHTN